MRDLIERIVSFGPRLPGSEADRRTTELISSELHAYGRPADLEEIRVRPAWHLTHAIHAALAVAGTLISSTVSEPLGMLILLLAAVSAYGDLTARYYIVRFLMPRRRTRNVTSGQPRPDSGARVILTANHDASRSGLLWVRRRRTGEPRRRRRRLLASLAGPVDIFFWTVMAALVAALARLALGDSTALDAVQFLLAAVLLTYLMLFVDAAISDPSPGASTNAAGVAALIEVGRRLQESAPRGVETWLVFPAAKEGLALGMRAWLKEHGDEIDPRDTFFVNVDTIGRGDVHHVTADGHALVFRSDQRLVRLCEELGSRPHTWRIGTDATQAAMAGFPSITICCLDAHGRMPEFHRTTDTPDRIDPDAVQRATDLVERIVRQIDAVYAPRADEAERV
ncbi:MAG TPA: M28 family peptidase [Solirubrobacterales bacterium]|nr:M28 family peptidase [Solirubrobacterales bacterium]